MRWSNLSFIDNQLMMLDDYYFRKICACVFFAANSNTIDIRGSYFAHVPMLLRLYYTGVVLQRTLVILHTKLLATTKRTFWLITS
jgi:hypothetical protein